MSHATDPNDTIVAIATALGQGAVGVLRLSGPHALACAAALVRRSPDTLPDRKATLATAYGADGNVLDQLVVLPMRGPRSFTGEDVVELQAHGGTANMARLLAACTQRGLRIAEPGEFTRRAVEAGKLDLTRAEGLLAVIEATSERALRVAQAQLAGALGDQIKTLEDMCTGVLSELEANLDFPDEQLPTATAATLIDQLDQVHRACSGLLAGFAAGKALRDGVTVALTGPVNAGKSSLFNALLGKTRSIVSPHAGTTRDYVEAVTQWDGITIRLIDTAGLRETTDEIERQGIELAAEQAQAADVQLVLRELASFAQDAEQLHAGPRGVLVLTKADLAQPNPPGDHPTAILTSSKDGRGLDALKAAVLTTVGAFAGHGEADPLVTTARQHQGIATARDYADACRAALARGEDLAIAAMELRAARTALAHVTGTDTTETLLDELFARFCIGK